MKDRILNFLYYSLTILFGVIIGVMVSYVKLEAQYTSSPSIELQHELMTIGDNWYYCPYCGEQIKEEK